MASEGQPHNRESQQSEELEDVVLLDHEPPSASAPKPSSGRESSNGAGLRGMLHRIAGFERLATDDGGVGFERPQDAKWCPEENCSFISRLFFAFANSLMQLGSSKHLDTDDLWDVSDKNAATRVTAIYESYMQQTRDIKTPHGAIWRSLLRAFGSNWLRAGLIKLVHDVVNLMSPYILRQLLLHLQEDGHILAGLGWACLLFAFGLTVPLLINQYFLIVFNVGLHVKTSLIHTLYRKSLRVTLAAKADLGAGSITNLQSNDAAKVWNLPQYGHVVWSGPLQILIIIYSLHNIIGWPAALAGFAMTVLLVPLNTVVGKAVHRVRKELIKKTDARIKAVSEVINGIKAIKLYAWEVPYMDRINSARDDEQRHIRKVQLLGCLNSIMFLGGPILVALCAFATYVHLGNEITAAVAFPALAFFDLLRFPIIMLPMQVMNFINARVALKRMQNFMNADEVQDAPQTVPATRPEEDAVQIDGGCFGWDAAQDAVLRDISLRVRPGSLVIVVGEVGCGKSSLLAALLHEIHKFQGTVRVRGSVAYTAQDPWIQNSTVEGNIRMGLPMNEARYESVIEACALSADLEMLQAGDQTEIGEKGVNLSGGQKHRVALARACYANADVYLLDDPLSAVDAHVGSHIFTECISDLLGGKTRILVTHQVQFLPKADLVIRMEGGKISHMGSYEELLEQGVTFAEYKMQGDGEQEGDEAAAKPDTEPAADASKPQNVGAEPGVAVNGKKPMKRSPSNGALGKQEDRSKGSVDKMVYLSYLRAWGPGFVWPAVFVSLACLERSLQVSQNLWLSVWSNATIDAVKDTDVTVAHKTSSVDTSYYMTVYFGLGMCSLVFQFCRAVVLVFSTLRASRRMHTDLLNKVMRLPMSFFDTQPSGRLMNRFTKDIEACDLSLQQTLSSFTTCVTSVLFSIFVVAGVTRGGVLLALIPLAFVYRSVQQYYLSTSRELKRLDSISFSPIFSNFSETLAGLVTVRAFRRQALFEEKNEGLMDRSNRCYCPIQVVNRWLSIRLEMMGQCIVFGTAVFATLVVRNSGLAGLALTSALNLVSLMNWTVRQSTELELAMNSVERLLEYEKHDSEQAAIVEGNRPAPSWPSTGKIQVSNLVVKYRPELPAVLKGISFTVEGHEKIGVCGRTGCGKSTLMMALYRIVEPAAGSVKIDGIEVTTIGLFDLRSKLSMVPQDPVIFTGPIRRNLDPFGTCADYDIWEALRQAGLESTVRRMEGGLDSELSEGGSNLSVGQRQLLCMARALLKKCSILLMDEATSNVDHDTDTLIQKTIRTAFKNCTVLTIAHRLHTIIDSDRILMLDKGNVLEFDSPKTLMQQPGSAFRTLVGEAASGKKGDLKASKSSVALAQQLQQDDANASLI